MPNEDIRPIKVSKNLTKNSRIFWFWMICHFISVKEEFVCVVGPTGCGKSTF